MGNATAGKCNGGVKPAKSAIRDLPIAKVWRLRSLAGHASGIIPTVSVCIYQPDQRPSPGGTDLYSRRKAPQLGIVTGGRHHRLHPILLDAFAGPFGRGVSSPPLVTPNWPPWRRS